MPDEHTQTLVLELCVAAGLHLLCVKKIPLYPGMLRSPSVITG